MTLPETGSGGTAGAAAGPNPSSLGQGTVVAYVALGANLGEPQAQLESAVAALHDRPGWSVRALSSLYRTAPVEAGGDDYFNAVAEVSVTGAPLEALDALQAVELAHGRARPFHHAPRTLDLDLLLWGQHTCQLPRLTLPHPRLHERAFVLVPLLELAPQCQAPGLGRLSTYLAAVQSQRISMVGRAQGRRWVRFYDQTLTNGV